MCKGKWLFWALGLGALATVFLIIYDSGAYFRPLPPLGVGVNVAGGNVMISSARGGFNLNFEACRRGEGFLRFSELRISDCVEACGLTFLGFRFKALTTEYWGIDYNVPAFVSLSIPHGFILIFILAGLAWATVSHRMHGGHQPA